MKKIKKGKKQGKTKIQKKNKEPRKTKRKNELTHFTTGSRSLDRFLGKGIVRGTSLLIIGNPHSGKKPIIMKMASDNCCKNEVVPIIVLTDLGVNNWIAMAKKNGWYCKKAESQIYYIDCYSQQFNSCPLAKNVKCLEVPFTLSTVSIAISDYIEKVKQEGKIPLVILHSVSTLVERFGQTQTYSFLQFLIGKLRSEGISIVQTMQLGVHGENFETSISSLNECVITMKEGLLNASGYITVKDHKWHSYKFVRNELVVEQ